MDREYYSIVNTALRNFYNRRIDIVSKTDIFKVLKQKNPYLYRAFGTNDAHQFIESILSDNQTSSDETIFGDFFEDVAINVARLSNENVMKSSADSIDMEIWNDEMNNVKLYAIKSGTKVFNAQSKRRQNQAFQEAQKRLKNIAITPIVGYSYGRKNATKNNQNNFQEVAGEEFWTSITGDKYFYLKLVDFIGQAAEEHKIIFNSEWDKSINKQFRKFIEVFGEEDGSINWKDIVKHSSSKLIDKEVKNKIRKVNK